MNTSPWAILGTTIAAFIGSFGGFFIKKATAKIKLHPIALLKNYYLLLGFGSYGLSVVIFIASLRFGELSVLYPTAATAYVWTVLMAKYFLKEEMNNLKWIGVGLIVLGVTFLGFGA